MIREMNALQKILEEPQELEAAPNSYEKCALFLQFAFWKITF